MNSIPFVSTGRMRTPASQIIALLLGLAAICFSLPAQATAQVVFSDDFNRADGAVGNGWNLASATGNGSGGGGTVPSASISGGKLTFTRSGWGSDAAISLTHSATAFQVATGTFTLPAVTGGTSGGEFRVGMTATNIETGAFVIFQLYQLNQSTDGFGIRFSYSTNGTWDSWKGYYPVSSTATNPGTLTISVTQTNASGGFTFNVLKADGSSLFTWSAVNSGLAGVSFDQVSLNAGWTQWQSPTGALPSVDSIVLSAIPEPSPLAMCAMSFMLGTMSLFMARRILPRRSQPS